ncbi:hypothetical protein BLJ79_10710 [Arthrobacter sp. UCD-GKA]|uniref:hypothetical protein n=1 Tax=Arthrobacter sp. UCD-GKA TaxID=1913576 RepID=UPI0008DE40E1|nr:hypothetical protein [Arthrobacter sp. UCD-GKA]OIH84597.1 hypothetical protein BLJ79_10710 [Arthrobacter sp. UCD-GKA]
MTPTTHATARSPFGAPAGLHRESALRSPGNAEHRTAGHSCKRTGLGMVASENNAKSLFQGIAPVGENR